MTYEAQDTWSSPWVSPSPISLHHLSVSPPLILVPHFLVLNHTPYCHIVFTYAAFPFSSIQSLSHVQLFATPSNSRSLLKFMSIESVMHTTNRLILCRLLLLLPSVFLSIRVFFSESVLLIRWPKYWSFSFSISPSNEYSGPISFRMDWLDLLAVQRTLKSLLQHHSSKASIPQCSAFFMIQLSHPYITTGKP